MYLKMLGRLTIISTAGFGLMTVVAAPLLGGTMSTQSLLVALIIGAGALGLIVSLIGQQMARFGTELLKVVPNGHSRTAAPRAGGPDLTAPR